MEELNKTVSKHPSSFWLINLIWSLNKIIFIISFLFNPSLKAQKFERHNVYVLGSPESASMKVEDVLLGHFEKQVINDSVENTVLLLGDFNHPRPNAEVGRERSYHLLDILSRVDGRVFAIPGHLEWSEGLDQLKKNELLIEKTLQNGDVVIPDDGCPGPEKKKIAKGVTLLAMDSQWWIGEQSEKFNRSNDCKNQTKEEVIEELIEHLDDEEGHVIVGLHHTLFSDGRFSGYYNLKDHIFPLTSLNRNLWIPLPVIGSIFPFYRKSFGTEQDMSYAPYQELRNRLKGVTEFRNGFFFLTGHEYNFQHFKDGGNDYLNISSGLKTTSLPNNSDRQYSSTNRSYGKLEFFDDGHVVFKLFELGDKGVEKVYEDVLSEKFNQFGHPEKNEIGKDKVTQRASVLYDKGGFHKFLFGDLHRKVWAEPVQHSEFDISNELGGLTPLKIGGGKTTKSIRLRDTTGKQYVLRTVDKKTYKIIPEIYRNSIVEGLIQDQVIGASHPYGALVVPPLADVAEIYHTNPKIVYVPTQSILGDYNKDMADQLYLFEERPSGSFKSADFFGDSRKIVSFTKMLEKLEESPGHHVHQEQVLKSRLFDMLIGDWDRHDDQWRWASFEEPSHLGGKEWLTYYEPIPRDRDQVFFDYDGVISSILKMVIPQLRIWQSFGNDIQNMKYFHFSGKHFDRTYLTELEKKDWLRLAQNLTYCMTDEVIEDAVKNLPPEIYELQGKELEQKLKIRRDKIESWAIDYYNFLSKYVDIRGSRFPDLFQVDRNKDGSTHVKVYQFQNDGKLRDLIFHRTFYANETDEIRLYGLESTDIFQLKGASENGTLIRVIGGEGEDQLEDYSRIIGPEKSVVVYDYLSDEGMKPGIDAIDKRSEDYSVNDYNRHEFYYNSITGFPWIGFDQDEGLSIKYQHSISTYGFRKLPYASKHDMGISYSFNKAQMKIDYSGTFTDVLGKADFVFNSYLHLPNRVKNFFGISNEASFSLNDFDDLDYFQYDQFDVLLSPAIKWDSKRGLSSLSVGGFYRFIKLGENDDKFISDFELSRLNDDDFFSSNFVGFDLDFSMSRIDNPIYPTRGIKFNFHPSYNLNLNDSDEKFTKLYSSLTLYNFFWLPDPLVLASKIETAINLGTYSFNQANFIGQSNGLRAFRNERFGGKSSVIFSNDLRLKLGTIRGQSIPTTFGLIGSYDVGRVWNPGEQSDVWHRSIGGGVFFSPLDILPISFYYLRSTEDTYNILFRLGFAF